ncbi:MAG: TonB family protein [Candidatus Dechloromonas phosphoritropha]|jgi:protein TonB
MNGVMRRALLVSIVIHLAVLLPFRDALLRPEPPGHSASQAIEALLISVPREKQRTLPYESLAPPSEKQVRTAAEVLAKPGVEKRSPVLPSFSRSTATDDVAVTERAAVTSGTMSQTVSPAALQAEDVSADGVRQYRLNLAREARRFKDYPRGARERGWEGVVVVVVNTVAGVGVPVVSLSQSSGFDVLDQAALDLVGQAVSTAAMPESLHGRQFALTLPIHYRLDE